MRLRAATYGDALWLLRVGLSWELAGIQYSYPETPLQLGIAPARALVAPRRAAAIIEVDERRAGYIGPNPLSGNYEYFLLPWARGQGLASPIIAEFLLHHRAGDRSRAFFVSSKNERSLRALLGAMTSIGWQEGQEYRVQPVRYGRKVIVQAG